MSQIVVDENQIRKLPHEERLKILREIFETSKDESERWDATWMAGEIAAEVEVGSTMFNKVSDLMAWALKHDDNTVVRHEICYQIAGRNMREKIPDLREAGLNDESALVRHEAIECLSIIQSEDKETLEAFDKALQDPDKHVRDTAEFVLKRLSRLKGKRHSSDTSAF